MAYLLGYLAEKERFAVESIADGRKAIERIDRGDAVDLVLLDVMLPYTDGFELLERLRAHADWKRVPVIILTSRTREHDAVRALGLGADDYLTKPFSPAELVARIRRRIGPASVPAMSRHERPLKVRHCMPCLSRRRRWPAMRRCRRRLQRGRRTPMPATRWHAPAPAREVAPRRSRSTKRCSRATRRIPTGCSASPRRWSRSGARAKRCRSSRTRGAARRTTRTSGAQTPTSSTSSTSSTPPTRCSRRPPPSSRNPPGRASGRRRCANGACWSAARGFPPTSATRNSPATGPRGRAPRWASTIVLASTDTPSPACTSRSVSTPATNSCSSAIPRGSATAGHTASPAISRPTRKSCPSGASRPMRAARCRTTGASAFACATRATSPPTSTRCPARVDKYLDALQRRLLAQRRERHPASTTRASGTCCASHANTATRAAPRSSSASARRPRPSRPASCR